MRKHRSLPLLFLLLPALACAGEPLTLHARDGMAIHGTLTHAGTGHDRILLLFHQAQGNRQEYAPLIPAFTLAGYDTLAIDQRSGGDLFGGRNRTVAAQHRSSPYIDALPDLKAALQWAKARHYRRVVAVGSSYSSSLAILLAAERPAGLTAIAAFSPGEYFGDRNLIKAAAARVAVPFYITTDPKEEANVSEVLARAQGSNVVRYRPLDGVHGASTLVEARDPAGCRANLQSFIAFLRRVGG
jgi:dienelactone hydrolase